MEKNHAANALAWVLGVIVLSIGPVATMVIHGVLPPKPYGAIYRPLIAMEEKPIVGDMLIAYLRLWVSNPSRPMSRSGQYKLP